MKILLIVFELYYSSRRTEMQRCFVGTPQGCKRDLSCSSYIVVNSVEFGRFRMFNLAVFVTS